MTSPNFNISSELAVKYETDCSAHNYHPLPVVFTKAKGAHVWDPEGEGISRFFVGLLGS